MKIFVYKLLLSCFFLFLLYQLTVNYTISEFKQKFYAIDTKANVELIKDVVVVEKGISVICKVFLSI